MKIKQFLRFAVIGTLVFVFEALLLTLLNSHFHLELEISRCISFIPAVISAWVLNRQFTFFLKNAWHGIRN